MPKGTVVNEIGTALMKNNYRMKIFNTINFKKSMHYNPFAYVHDEKDILKLVTTLIANTKGEGKGGDEFWEKSEKLIYSALIGYIHYEAPEEEQNFSTLLEMINAMEVREDDEEFKNPVDLMFDELAEREPDHFAVRQYAKYKLAAGKTAKSILVSCGARLAPFDIKELREITAYDELELDTLGDTKTALFLIMSDTDATFNFLISMIYTQLFNLLCEKADDVYGGRLPVHVSCLIDEMANIGQIPNLEKLMATIRSREISACLVLQAKSQLKAIYKDNADTIIGNCDSQVFLGGSVVCQHYGIDTAEYSFPYVAGWSSDKEVPELKASLDTIRRAAADLIVKIDEKVAELTQGKDQNQFAEIDQWIAAHEDEFPFDNPGVNQPTGFIEITPPVDIDSLKADQPIEITAEGKKDGAERKEDPAKDSKQDEKEKPSKRKSVKKQIAEKKDKEPKQSKPKKVDTKNLGEAI